MRRLAGSERLWLTADRLAPPFVNQLVLEDPSGDLSAADWGSAVLAAASATPGSSARLTGSLGWSRWVDDRPPRVRRVDGSAWDGQDGGGAPFLASGLPPRSGPTAEVLVVEGDTARVVVRTHHAAMDGRGTTIFARRLFAAARGETLPPLMSDPASTDASMAASLGGVPEAPGIRDCPSVLGEARPAPMATRWVRRDFSGSPGSRLLPRVAVALARRVGEGARRRVRIDVPVDLRRHAPSSEVVANLTGLLRLPVGALLGTGEPSIAVAAALDEALESRQELGFPLAADRMRWLPLALMTWAGRSAAEKALAEGSYSTTATVSNLGRMDLDALSAPGFTPRSAFWIPPGSPGLPLFLTLTGGRHGVTLCGAAPLALADGGRLEHLMDELVAGLAGQ